MVCVCGPSAHVCVGGFCETDWPGLGADFEGLAVDLVDLVVTFGHRVHVGLKVATKLVRMAGLFPGTTVSLCALRYLWRL